MQPTRRERALKGFPNQFGELSRIAAGIRCLVDIEAAGKNGKDDGVALVRTGVAGTAHRPQSVEAYLKAQDLKSPSNQSFRTRARGLRELFRLMGLIDDTGSKARITELGKAAAAFAGKPWNEEQINFWRTVIRNIEHDGGDETISHPYQVLIRLVARKPGISRAKCALALEARDDSLRELERIVGLADLDEDEIIKNIGTTQSNWDNAKKVLPRFAEQLGDVIRSTRGTYVLADAPGRADDAGAAAGVAPKKAGPVAAPRAPRSSRKVTPDSIGRAGIAERSYEMPLVPPDDLKALKAAIEARASRLKRHNLLVREFAGLFAKAGADLYEDPFDILALLGKIGALVEMKTLDGTEPDEKEQVRNALGQLLYYEGFLDAAVAGRR